LTQRHRDAEEHKAMKYESVVDIVAESVPGVTLRVARMSFGRRLELMRRVRELARKVECFEAGGIGERMDAGMLRAEVDRLYVEWGVVAVGGLMVDGAKATAAWLVERGPEELFREALVAVRREAGLSEDERKN
jgi:hypothetical protein